MHDARPRMHIGRIARISMILATVAALGGCDDDGPEVTGPSDPVTVSVFLTDAPGDVDSVWVQVDELLALGPTGPATSLLDEPTELINLVTLTGGEVLPLNEEVEVDLTAVSELRLVLGGAVLQTSDGSVFTFGGAEHPGGLATTGDLQCPSCSQSGLKVKLADDIALSEGENGLLMDFDVSQSFGQLAGESGMWVMRPVIHVTDGDPDDIQNGTATGEITGTVALGTDVQGEPLTIPDCGGEARTLEAFVPLATATTLADDEGEVFVFSGETEATEEGFAFEIRTAGFDTFTLGHDAATTFDAEQLVWTATVEPAEVILEESAPTVDGVSYTITGVSCEAIG